MTRCPTCGQELPRYAVACPVCRTVRRSVSVVLTATVFLALAGVLGVVAWSRIRTRKSDDPSRTLLQTSDGPARFGRLRTECSVVPLAVDAEAFEELAKVESAKFGLGYPKLKREGRVFEVQGNTLVRIVLEEKSRVKVAVTDDSRSERVGYSRPEWVFPPVQEWTPSIRQ